MAPKRRGSVYGAPVMKKKRTVRRPVRETSPSPQSSSSSSTPCATPVPATSQVDFLAGRVITTGRKVDFELFEAEGFLIGRQIREMGWEKLCSLDCPTYPALVKDFYKNLSRGDNGLISFIRGVKINLSTEILSRLLNIPTAGPSTYSSDDRSAALSRLLNREIVDFEEIIANQLPLELRLLHNICSRILFPKTGRFDYVSERDVFVMDAVVTGRPINLPGMIIGYIADSATKRKSSLPYGMILTLLFQKQGLMISESEPKRDLRHTDYYSLATLHRMGFNKVNGKWERKNSMDERTAEVGTEAPGPSEVRPPVIHSPGPSCSIPPASRTDVPDQSTIGFTDTQLDQLKALLLEQEKRINDKLEDHRLKMLQLFYSLEDKISSFDSTLGTSANTLKVDLMRMFDKIKSIGEDSDIYSKCNAELQEKIVVASTFLNDKLNDFVKTQEKAMSQILEELKRLLRIGY